MNELLGLCLLGAFGKLALAEQSFRTHDVQDENLVPVITVEDAAGRLHDLTIARLPEFLRATPTLRVIHKLSDVAENSFDKLRRCNWVLQCDVVGNCVKIREGGF